MNPVLAKAVSHALTRAQIGWPLLVVALALYGPADTVTRLVLLAAGTLATIKAPTLPAQAKARRIQTTKKPTPKAGERP